MQHNINPYNPEQFKKQFESTDICRNVAKDFNNLWWNDPEIYNLEITQTPRQFMSTISPGFSMIPFYYLQSLLEKTPNTIYDLGCGWNIFKKYIPEIVGVDPHYHNQEICTQIDQQYVSDHQDYFQSVFSINALHFRPLSELRQVYEEFISMVAPGGRGFLSVNIKRMLELDEDFKKVNHGPDILDQYVRTQLNNLPCTYLIFDVNLDPIDAWLDGNVRLVFER